MREYTFNRLGIGVMRFFSYAAIVAAALGMFMTQAFAVHQAPHPAPAPLLGAGIPAFFALGGGVLIARLKARRRKHTEDTSSGR